MKKLIISVIILGLAAVTGGVIFGFVKLKKQSEINKTFSKLSW